MREGIQGEERDSTYVLVNEVQATVAGNEASNLLSVLDELHTDSLTNSGVRLLGLKTTVTLRETD